MFPTHHGPIRPMIEAPDLQVRSLGECRYESPYRSDTGQRFISDAQRVRLEDEVGPDVTGSQDALLEKAGPRARIFFEPARTTAAIVTCGGLSPGLNNVIRSIVLELRENYGVGRVVGVRDGFRGLNPDQGRPLLELDDSVVKTIHHLGGTILGSSRGSQDVSVMADFIQDADIDVLFCVGGDGTQRGACALSQAVHARGRDTAIVGIPKTIDNDIPYVWMSFGYATAVEIARQVVSAAFVEAAGAPNGVGLVKLMGRDAGFIAAGAALASQDADFVLVPETPFPLDGTDGLLAEVERRVQSRGQAVIVVAEGAGQHHFTEEATTTDASGNLRHRDIGVFLRQRIEAHFAARGMELNLKYIDPSYLIRGAAANSWDRILSDRMARMAVHAAMAGKTEVLIGYHHETFVHVPISTAVASRRRMNLQSDTWSAVLACTRQPRW